MIIPKKTLFESEKSWSVILNPVKGELAKGHAIEVLSQFLSLIEEDASELVENAPVILLEDLHYEAAQKVKYYFFESGLEILLTNDPLQKRKCFRTVWNEDPRLNFMKLESSPFDPSISTGARKEVLPSDQAVRHIREEVTKNDVMPSREKDLGDSKESKRKYEDLSEQHSLLNEEKMIQDQKMEALEREVRFLRDKENATASSLKALTLEKENLLHELEALRVKRELVLKQSETQDSSQEKRLAFLESENKVLKERFDTLRREYEDAENLWAQELKAKEGGWRTLENELQTCRVKLTDLSQKVDQAERVHGRALLEEGLNLREKALKDLVRRQEELEKEITEKEKLLKSVLSEQEILEKEIVRAKQLKNQA